MRTNGEFTATDKNNNKKNGIFIQKNSDYQYLVLTVTIEIYVNFLLSILHINNGVFY